MAGYSGRRVTAWHAGTDSFLWTLLLNPWVASSFAAALIAALSWMVTMTKLPLSHAYPFVSLSFALVLLFSWLLLNDRCRGKKLPAWS